MDNDREIIKSIASIIRNVREQSGISVKQLSLKAGLTPQTLHNIEIGDSDRMDLIKVNKIACALNLNLFDLLGQTSPFKAKNDKNIDSLETLPEVPFTYHENNTKIGVYAVPGLTDVAEKVISQNEIVVDVKKFTLEAWIFPVNSAKNGEEKIIALSPSKWNEIYIGWEDNKIWFGIVPDDEHGWMRLRSQAISLFEWHHVVATSDGITASLFIDQVEVGRLKLTQELSSYKLLGRIFVGCLGYQHDKSKKADRFFHGSINQPRIWNNALNPFDLKKNQLVSLS